MQLNPCPVYNTRFRQFPVG